MGWLWLHGEAIRLRFPLRSNGRIGNPSYGKIPFPDSLTANSLTQLDHITDVKSLLQTLGRPNERDVQVAGKIDGDVMVLGAAGKMGPTLVSRIVNAFQMADQANRVIAVSRFQDDQAESEIRHSGATVIAADLMNEKDLAALPDAANVIHLVGMKFGSSGKSPMTWAVNTFLPGRVAQRFRDANIVALSTGNVYGEVAVDGGGSVETDELRPVGEYAQSCVGRERIFQYFSERHRTPVCLVRLNYAVETRYGVLLDIGQNVFAGRPVSLAIGHVNVIWQGDANSVCFRALQHCRSPAEVLNLTGPQHSVREIAERFGRLFDKPPRFEGQPRATALLSDASRCEKTFGGPATPVDQVIELVARWIATGQPTHGKPTKFERHDGRF